MSNGNCRKLAPWEEIGYFDDPIWTAYKISAVGQVLTPIPANPHRVILAVSSLTAFTLSLDETGLYGVGLTPGANGGTVFLHEKHDGPLPSLQWFVITQSGTNFSVLQVLLREFPECNQ